MAKRKAPRSKKATKKPVVAKEVNGKSLLDSEISSTDAAALLGHKQRNWVRDHVPKTANGKYDPRVVVAKWVETKVARVEPGEVDDLTLRRKLAETQNVEEQLRINRLRADRLEGRLMSVDWVHQWLRQVAAELRKPIEIIGRNHPEHKQLILNGLDNASAKVSEMLVENEVPE